MANLTLEQFERICDDSFNVDSVVALFWDEYHLKQALKGGVI